MRRLVASGLFTLVAAVVVGLLPGPLTVTAQAVEPAPTCFLDGSGLACPTVHAPARLISPRVLSGVSPAIADAMRAFEDQAVDAVLTDHDLRPADRDDVLSYARHDAEAEMFALMVQALETNQADRTTRQQAIADWFSQILTNQRQPGPMYAALEYAKFMGKTALQQQQLQMLIEGGGSEDQIKAFLTGTPEPYDTTDTAHATGGFCRYHPPSPYETEYDGQHSPDLLRPLLGPPPRLSSGDADLRPVREVGGYQGRSIRWRQGSTPGANRHSLPVPRCSVGWPPRLAEPARELFSSMSWTGRPWRASSSPSLAVPWRPSPGR